MQELTNVGIFKSCMCEWFLKEFCANEVSFVSAMCKFCMNKVYTALLNAIDFIHIDEVLQHMQNAMYGCVKWCACAAMTMQLFYC